MGIENTNIVLRSLGVEKLVFATDYPDSRSIRAIEFTIHIVIFWDKWILHKKKLKIFVNIML